MRDDDELPRPKTLWQPLKLDRLSIEEMEGYVGFLEEQIPQVKAEIAKRRAQQEAAKGLFKF